MQNTFFATLAEQLQELQYQSTFVQSGISQQILDGHSWSLEDEFWSPQYSSSTTLVYHQIPAKLILFDHPQLYFQCYLESRSNMLTLLMLACCYFAQRTSEVDCSFTGPEARLSCQSTTKVLLCVFLNAIILIVRIHINSETQTCSVTSQPSQP